MANTSTNTASLDTARTMALSEKLTRTKKFRGFLIFALIVEGFILLLLNPSYPGIKWLEVALTAIGGFFTKILWPTFPQDQGTYKETVFNICQWVGGLPLYPLLRFAARWAPPVCFIGTIIRGAILRMRIRGTFKASTAPKGTAIRCALDRGASTDANNYLKEQMDMNRRLFPKVGGIRVQLFNDASYQKRDYIVPWDEKGTVTLKEIINKGDVKVIFRDGRVFMDTASGAFELSPNQPIVFNRTNAGGKILSQSVITWIGGSQ